MKKLNLTMIVLFLSISPTLFSQSEIEKILTEISTAPSAQRIENDIIKLVGFGTRHTLSDTISATRGIGAARRWVKSSFEEVSKNCDNCLEVSYLGDLVKADGSRIVTDTKVVNVMAIQRGTTYPNRYVMMSGDIDSRVSDANNFTSDAPGANDNATGLAGTIEASRILSKYKFPVSII
ncbi:MAG: M28 family peptidase, partial [Flavobacteriaceae bacterium]|nr:M28 family peptidase [Flavobacteriaceae bacterium]